MLTLALDNTSAGTANLFPNNPNPTYKILNPIPVAIPAIQTLDKNS